MPKIVSKMAIIFGDGVCSPVLGFATRVGTS
jgi:hypothetical protein